MGVTLPGPLDVLKEKWEALKKSSESVHGLPHHIHNGEDEEYGSLGV